MEKNLSQQALPVQIAEGANGVGPGNAAAVWTYPVGAAALKYMETSDFVLCLEFNENLEWTIKRFELVPGLRNSLFGLFVEMLNVFVYYSLIQAMMRRSKELDDIDIEATLVQLLKDFINTEGLLPVKGYQLLLQRVTNDYKRHGAIFPSEELRDILLPVTDVLRLYLPTPDLVAQGYELVLHQAPAPEGAVTAANIATCGLIKAMVPTTYRERVENSIKIFDDWLNFLPTARPNLVFSPQYRQITLRQRNKLIASGDPGLPLVLGTDDGRRLINLTTRLGGRITEKLDFSPYILLSTAVAVGYQKRGHSRTDWLRIYKIDVINMIKPVKESIQTVIDQIQFEAKEYETTYSQLTKQRSEQLVDTAIIRSLNNLKGRNDPFGYILTRRAKAFKYPIINIKVKRNQRKFASRVNELAMGKRMLKMRLTTIKEHLDRLIAIGMKIVEDLKVEETDNQTFEDLLLLNETLGIAADDLEADKSNIAELAMELPEPEDALIREINELEGEALETGSVAMAADIEQLASEPIPEIVEDRLVLEAPEIESAIVASAPPMPIEEPPMIEAPLVDEPSQALGLDAPIEISYIPAMEEFKEEKKEIPEMQQLKSTEPDILAVVEKIANKEVEKMPPKEVTKEQKEEVKEESKEEAKEELKEEVKEVFKEEAPIIINIMPQDPRAVEHALETMSVPALLETSAVLEIAEVGKVPLKQFVARKIANQKSKIAVKMQDKEKIRQRKSRMQREKEFQLMMKDLKGKRNIISDIKTKKNSGMTLSKAEKKWVYYDNMMRITYNQDLRSTKKNLLSALMQRRLRNLIHADNEKDPEMYKIPEMGKWADIRALGKGTLMYELVEFPRINILHLDDKYADEIVRLWAELIMQEFMPLSGQNVIEFVYYATDSFDQKVGGGGYKPVTILATDTLEDIMKKVGDSMHELCDSVLYDLTISGSGNSEIDLVLPEDRRKHNSEGEIISSDRANVFVQYMRLQRPIKELSDKMPIKAFASNLIKPHNAVRSLIKYSTKSTVGVCIFEAFQIIISDGYKSKKRIDSEAAWNEYISGLLLEEYPNFIALCQDGDIKEFLHQILLLTGKNIAIFNFYTNDLWAPRFDIACEENIMLYYANHVHVTSITKLIEHYGLKEKYDGTNLSELLHGVKRRQKSKKFREFQLNSMTPDKNLKMQQKERKTPTQKEIKHVHWGFDYETHAVGIDGKQEPYLLAVVKVAINGEDQEKTEKYTFWGHSCTLDFIFKVINPIMEQKDSTIQHHFWSYNGANFDFHFLIKELQRIYAVKILGSSTSFKSLKLGKNISFLDLACWYNMPYNKDLECNGLRALAKVCKTKHQKGDFNYNVKLKDLDDPSFKEKAITYCLLDVYVLNDLINMLVVDLYEKFEFMGKKACLKTARFYPHSAASLALAIYKNCFMGPLTNLKASKSKMYKLERESYHGGITLPFKTMATLVKCFDINSSYPFVMLTHEMPYKYINSEQYRNGLLYELGKAPAFNNYDLIEYWGFEFPKKTFLPCLMVKSPNGSLIQLLKHDTGTSQPMAAWGYEIKMALSQGARIWVKARHIYEGKIVFSSYVKHFYEAKKKAKRDHNTAAELFNKNLLNSLQGKLGEKERENKVIGQLHIVANSIFERGTEQLKGIEYLNDGVYRATWKLEKDEELSRIGALVRFPSYIAAAARINLIKAMLSVPSEYIVYCDTDSIFLSGGKILPSEFLSDDELGKFKEEKDKESDIMLCFGAKNYVLLKGEKIQLKCKGIRPPEDVFAYIDSLTDNKEIKNEVKPFFKKSFGAIYVTSCERMIRNTVCFKRSNYLGQYTTPFLDMAEYKNIYKQNESKKVLKPQNKELVKQRKMERDTMLNMMAAVAYETQDKYGTIEQLEDQIKSFMFGMEEESKLASTKRAIELYLKEGSLKKELLLAISANSPELLLKLKNSLLNIHVELDQTIENIVKEGYEKEEKEVKEHAELLDYLLK